MQLEYASSSRRRYSIIAIASLIFGFAAFIVSDWTIFDTFASLPFLNPLAVQLWLLATVLLGIILGAIATVRRRRLWWLGLAGTALGAITIGQWVYFLVTFVPPIK